jgi:hypothetical protein
MEVVELIRAVLVASKNRAVMPEDHKEATEVQGHQ